MNAVRFDTLKLARSLEAAGMSAPLTAGTSEALADAMAGGEFSTKSDIAEVKHEIGEVRHEVAALRAETRSGDELLRRDMTIKLGSMILVAVGVLLAAMRFMPHP